jgi:hypothetical protein
MKLIVSFEQHLSKTALIVEPDISFREYNITPATFISARDTGTKLLNPGAQTMHN